jgi:hypothetical protein
VARRMRRRRAANPMMTIAQVLLLLGLLMAILFYRERIGTGAGALVDSLSSSDIEVRDDRAPDASPPP